MADIDNKTISNFLYFNKCFCKFAATATTFACKWLAFKALDGGCSKAKGCSNWDLPQPFGDKVTIFPAKRAKLRDF